MNKDDLLNRAKEQASKAPAEFRTSIELYYIARYFVSVFEARNHAIPIQVWNEYRNALDHFFRHITSDNYPSCPKQSENLKRMEGHLKRAALDIIKLTCHKSDEYLDNEITKYTPNALLFIDNGDFIKSLQKQRKEIKNIFLIAKTEDYNFGINSQINKRILSSYIDAAVAYEDLRDTIDNRTTDLQEAEIRYQEIKGASENSGRKKTLTQNIFVGIITGTLFFILGYLLK